MAGPKGLMAALWQDWHWSEVMNIWALSLGAAGT
jgi:hypothetical protein